MSTPLTPSDFGATTTATPAPAGGTSNTALPGAGPATGPLPVIPGPDFPVTPPATDGDPAQFVNSAGQIKQQVMEAEMHAEEEAAQTQVAVNNDNALGRLLKSALFASKRGEFKALADFHSVAHAESGLDQLVHWTLANIYNDAVTRLEQMPAPQAT